MTDTWITPLTPLAFLRRSAEVYPDKVAIEIVAFGPGIELLRPENPNRKMVESLVAQGARFNICLNTVDTLERESGKRPEFIAAAASTGCRNEMFTSFAGTPASSSDRSSR